MSVKIMTPMKTRLCVCVCICECEWPQKLCVSKVPANDWVVKFDSLSFSLSLFWLICLASQLIKFTPSSVASPLSSWLAASSTYLIHSANWCKFEARVLHYR